MKGRPPRLPNRGGKEADTGDRKNIAARLIYKPILYLHFSQTQTCKITQSKSVERLLHEADLIPRTREFSDGTRPR